jgi:hypothetical protein
MSFDCLSAYAELIDSMVGGLEASSQRVAGLRLGSAGDSIEALRLSRPAYRPLLLCDWMIGGRTRGDTGLWLQEGLGALDQSALSMFARYLGGQWLSDSSSVETARNALDLLIERQQPSGEFLAPDGAANPESRWYEELVILHAVGNFAVRAPSAERNLSVKRAAEFHLHNTQPDHATAEPWALLAFVQHAPMLADQVLHAMSMQYAGGITGIPLLLLRDALYGLRLLQKNDQGQTTD